MCLPCAAAPGWLSTLLLCLFTACLVLLYTMAGMLRIHSAMVNDYLLALSKPRELASAETFQELSDVEGLHQVSCSSWLLLNWCDTTLFLKS